MRKAIKKRGILFSVWKLSENTAKERELIAEGRIKITEGGAYELFSQEALGENGQKAQTGDWFKVDSQGRPYPNDAAFFESHHRQVEGDTYEQVPSPVDVWLAEDGMCDEVRFLTEHRGLVLDEEHPAGYFRAPLWGTELTAAKDAALVFYSITRDGSGAITDADFSFVERSEFEKTYEWLP